MADDDLSLVKRCLRDDPHALTALVQRFQAEVFGLCVRLLRHSQDAEGIERLRGFPEPTVIDQVEEAILSLQGQGVRGLIFDLRGNAGGRLGCGVVQ